MTNEELILKKLDELAAEVKEVRTEIKDVGTESASEFKKVRADSSEMKVNQVKLEGDLGALESKMGGKLGTLATKFEAYIADVRERKTDTNERWKIAGIITSGCLALVSLFLSILNRR